MPSLFNPLERNAFGFPRGTNGEIDETKAAIQPQAKPLQIIEPGFSNRFTSGFQGGTRGYGALTPFVQYLSGQGPLSITQNDSENKPLSRFSVEPGGVFNLQNLQSGFSFTGNVRNKSVGADFPVNIGGNKGIVGVEGSLNNVDPYIRAKFAFGQRPQLPVDDSEQKVSSALNAVGLNQANTSSDSPELSARDFLNQMVDKYRSSDGRDPNSPSTWR